MFTSRIFLEPQDILYVYQRGIYQFLYYAERYGYRSGDYILGVDDLDIYDGKKYQKQNCKDINKT